MSEMITTREAAEILRLTEKTLRNWRADGRRHLPYHKYGRGAVRYKRTIVERFKTINEQGIAFKARLRQRAASPVKASAA